MRFLSKISLNRSPEPTPANRTWIPIFLLLFITACGNAPEEATPGAASNDQGDSLASINPCELLTAEEVESVFGEEASADAGPTSAGPIRSCTFSTDKGGKFFILQLGPETAIEVDTGADDSTPVSDLGDEAVFFSGMLRVRVGETVLQVSTWHPSSRQDEALIMTREIARLALD